MVDKSTTENVIEDYLVERVERLGGECLKLRPPQGRGFPDRTCFIPGVARFCVELKRPKGGRITVHQRRWQARLALSGTEVFFCTTKGEVDRLLDLMLSAK